MVEKNALVTIGIVDNKRRFGKMQFRFIYYGDDIPDAPNDFSQFLPDFMTELDTYIGGRIVSCTVSMDVPLPTTIKTVADADSDVEEVAQTKWLLDNGMTSIVNIPTLGDEWFNAARILDQEVLDFLYIWFVNATELPSGGWIIPVVDARGEPFSGSQPFPGKRIFRKNRKQ